MTKQILWPKQFGFVTCCCKYDWSTFLFWLLCYNATTCFKKCWDIGNKRTINVDTNVCDRCSSRHLNACCNSAVQNAEIQHFLWQSWTLSHRHLRRKGSSDFFLHICPPSVMVGECFNVQAIMANLHLYEGTINAYWYKQVLEQHILPTYQRLFQGRLCQCQTTFCS